MLFSSLSHEAGVPIRSSNGESPMKNFARTFVVVLTLSMIGVACSSPTGLGSTDVSTTELEIHDPGAGN